METRALSEYEYGQLTEKLGNLKARKEGGDWNAFISPFLLLPVCAVFTWVKLDSAVFAALELAIFAVFWGLGWKISRDLQRQIDGLRKRVDAYRADPATRAVP